MAGSDFETPPASSVARTRTGSRNNRNNSRGDAGRQDSRGSNFGASQLPVLGSSVDGKAEGKGGGHGKKKLGMFKGVLVPTCENMWGVIIFLRFYTIVGYAGLGYTIVIVTISFFVALITALSLSAIATCGTSHNITGVYPMLARALGKEVATATGLIYFLGIVCLAVLECLGATEELFMVAPVLRDTPIEGGGPRIWGSIFMAVLVVFVGGAAECTISYSSCASAHARAQHAHTQQLADTCPPCLCSVPRGRRHPAR